MLFGLLLVGQAFWAATPPREPPPASDAWWLPTEGECERQLSFNTNFWMNMNEERKLWPAHVQPVFAETIEETKALRRIWLAARNAASAGPPAEDYAREWLGNLRAMLGDDDYYSGRMPPAVPVWRFREKK